MVEGHRIQGRKSGLKLSSCKVEHIYIIFKAIKEKNKHREIALIENLKLRY